MATPKNPNDATLLSDDNKSTAELIADKNGNQLDTGTGGFSVDGDLYSLDPGGANEFNHEKWSPGRVSVDDDQKDIAQTTRETLGKYLGKVTKAKAGIAKVPNEFPVDDDSVVAISITDEKGYPAQLSQQTNATQFNNDVGSYRSDAALSLNINRGKSSKQLQDGNELLANAVTIGPDSNPKLDDASPVSAYTSAVLSQNKWTSPNNPLNGVPKLKRKGTLGKSNYDDEISFGQLSNVGVTLSMRSSMELNAASKNFNPTSTGAVAGALLPGASQAAISRVETTLLTAKDVIEEMTREEVDNYLDITSLSWGTLNNVNDQYSGLSSLGMVALSAALVAALELSVEAISILFVTGSPKKHPSKDSLGRYSKGNYYYGKTKPPSGILGAATSVASGDLGTLLGITPTNVMFGNALRKGTRAFFGADSSDGLNIVGALSNAAQAPGYNAVVARAIIRSAVSVIDKIKNVNTSNPIDTTKQLIDLVDVIRSSKLIAACNIFAQLGDALLSLPDPTTSIVDEQQSRVQHKSVRKSRLNDSLKLAWSQGTTNTMLMLPKSIQTSISISDELGAFYTDLEPKSEAITISADNRISAEEVEKQEILLDSEYVPFYFHDLRTNEIVSFHAFLASMTDDYTANYEASDAFGRVEQVKVYKSTQRKVSFSFFIVSTSREDFDLMWIKINKLTTLLYPQYTAGKLITDGEGYTVRQPFSQLIGASPMIRLRIGDVIKSNYSRFNLARLFGLGDPNMKLNGVNTPNPDSGIKSFGEVVGKLMNTTNPSPDCIYYNPVGYTVIPMQDDYNLCTEMALGFGMGIGFVENKDQAAVFKQVDDKFMLKNVKKFNEKAVVAEIALNIENENQTSDDDLKKYDGKKYIFPIEKLHLTDSSKLKLYRDKVPTPPSDTEVDFSKELKDFMSTDANGGNAIAKSFKTTGGKGLAGVVDSMNFDWLENKPWEIDLDRKAPKICKVTVSFSPIHDISPGLDHTGYNRAPIYQVGPNAPIRTRKKK